MQMAITKLKVFCCVIMMLRESHLALDCAVVDLLAARAEEVGEAVADHAPGPRAAAAPPPAPGLGHSAAGFRVNYQY